MRISKIKAAPKKSGLEVMIIRRWIALSMIACLTVLFTITNVFAGSTSVKINISARVLPSLDYTVLRTPDMVEVTQSDIQNGYKDITEGSVISVTTNDPNGYILSVCGLGSESFTSLDVSVDGKLYEIPFSGCTEIYMPFKGIESDIKRLNYRVYFSSEMRQGSYMLPMQVEALFF